MNIWHTYVSIGLLALTTGCNRAEPEVPPLATTPSLNALPESVAVKSVGVPPNLSDNADSQVSAISVNQQIVDKKAAARVNATPATYDPNLAPAPLAR